MILFKINEGGAFEKETNERHENGREVDVLRKEQHVLTPAAR